MKRLIFFVYLLVNVVLSSELYFIEPKDGQVVEKTFVVKFGLKDFGVAPAGYDINNTGHHHLLIDVELPDLNKPIPADANHLHFGGGQTEALLTLSLSLVNFLAGEIIIFILILYFYAKLLI